MDSTEASFCSRVPDSCEAASLKRDLCSELQDARLSRRYKHPWGCGQIGIGPLKVDMIECIDGLESELKVEAVAEAKIAEQGEIDAVEAVTCHDVPACVAEGSQLG